jgi:hypothetical protein
MDRADTARDRGTRVPERVLLGEESAKRRVIDRLQGPMRAGEKGRQMEQIGAVGGHGVRREMALQAKVLKERRDQVTLGRGQRIVVGSG